MLIIETLISTYWNFRWNDWESQNLYVVPVKDGKPRALTRSRGFLGGSRFMVSSSGQFGDWSPDGKHMLYSEGGDLYLVSVPGGKTSRFTETSEAEAEGRFSPDGTHVAYRRGGNIYVVNLKDAATKQLTKDGRAYSRFSWSPDGKWIAAHVSDPPTASSSSPSYSGPLLAFKWRGRSQSDVVVVAADGNESYRLLASPENETMADWSPDGEALLIERLTIDTKRRTLFWVAVRGKEVRTIYHQEDEKYITPKDRLAVFSPDGQSILFTSDEDGWNHLHIVNVKGGPPVQITSGDFEVSFPSWSPDGETVFFVSTEAGPEQRQIYAVASAGGARTQLTHHPGTNTTAVLSPRGDRIAFVHSDPSHLPDLWLLDVTPGTEPRQLTDSMTSELHAFPWQTPELVTYTGKHHMPIRAQLFLPPELDRKKKHPAIVHVHGAAIDQEVYLGPGPDKNDVVRYGWHQRMASRGYVVFNIDYRGSYGYGRDFRTADYLVLGDDPIADVVKGVEYLESLGFVDVGRLGIYGMSTGGRMVMTVLFKYPDLFQAGVNFAGGFDYMVEGGPWEMRNPWVYNRLGRPDQNPEAFFSASAINHVDGLKAPILTLHGTADTSVNLTNSIKLVDELLKRGKRFEFEIYPGEMHFFARRSSQLDAWRKVERFFDEYVGQK